jgi:hypothetical protein
MKGSILNSFVVFFAAILAPQIIMAASLTDRFDGPLTPGDIFPTTLENLDPLNPADLAFSKRSSVEFGIQADGNNLTLGLPNFLIGLSNQEIKSDRTSAMQLNHTAKKYLLGYAISSKDLGLGSESGTTIALGFHIRYLDYKMLQGNKEAQSAYPDMGISGLYKQFHLDAAILNMTALSGKKKDSLPGMLPQEINFGLAYGPPNNWLVSARLGIQDSSRSKALVDLSLEKLFFQSVTFRVGSQRKYTFGSGEATKQAESILSGGVWYRITKTGMDYQYPEKDVDIFTLGTLKRLMNNVQFGLLIALANEPDQTDTKASNDKTSIFATLGKSF